MHYKVRYHCGNCGKYFEKEFRRGEPAPRLTTCNLCGCYNMARKSPTSDWYPRRFYYSRYEKLFG